MVLAAAVAFAYIYRCGLYFTACVSFWLNQEGSILGLINSNLAILTLLCLMTVGIGNTNVNFHHELAVEQAIRNHHYEAARMIGAKSLETTRTLTVLRAYAMSLEGTMGSICLNTLNIMVRKGFCLRLILRKLCA